MENHQIDLDIGLRLRQRRMALGITRADLAKAMGLTFQQIRKYERGEAQVRSGRLYELAAALEVPVSFFFDGGATTGRAGAGAIILANLEPVRLVRYYLMIGNRAVREAVRRLVTSKREPSSP